MMLLLRVKKKKNAHGPQFQSQITDHATKNQDGDLTNIRLETLN